MITLIEQHKKNNNRYNVYINDEYSFSVHEDVLVKHRLYCGQEINPTSFQQMMKDEEIQQAYSQAIRYITRKPRAMKEVEKKLIEQCYDENIIQIVIKKLLEQKYINDEDFANRLTQYRFQFQKKGRRWIKQELVQKGVTKEYIEQAIDQIDEHLEYEIAYGLAKKRWDRQKGETPVKNRKISNYLLRRGYTNAIVIQVLEELLKDDQNDEN